jgi:hypothetical protein
MFSAAVQILKKFFALLKSSILIWELFWSGDRNVIKLFDLNGQTINIKSFKVPYSE